MNKTNERMDHTARLRAKFGMAQADITPPLGIYARNWGAAIFDNANGVHRPLWMQCLAIETASGQQALLLTADLGWWKNQEDERRLRQALLQHFNLQEEQLLFCLSHTHAGPSICSNDVEQPGGSYIRPYLDALKAAAVTCIHEALAGMEEHILVWSTGCCNLATKRDLKVGNDYLIGYDPEAKADQTLLVGELRSPDGQLKAVFANYACHPTTFAHENRLLSPDFVGALRELVTTHTSVPCMFLQGASGDLAPKKQYVSDPEIVDANGRQLGYAVLSALETHPGSDTSWTFDSALVSGAPLAIWKEKPVEVSECLRLRKVIVRVPYKQLPDAELIEQEYHQCEDRVLKDRLWRKLNTRIAIGNNSHATLPVWIWRLGTAVLVAQPNEAYSEFQEKLRAFFPGTAIICINIANGYVGYLPPQDLYDKDIYAVWQTPYAPGALELLIEETRKEIEKILTDETAMD
ncbi:hypothetical protein LQ567_14630 [Niabella pedocola]|uniref:Alkaline ceramidase n=1 Tax=Niabella pedocola TaxID=1752077 RepID=A0ABS8PVS7_9BACT|nr:hypothetical protein [Niabella pedocola]MCD2424011.1 hypothetical protein [Niabella pedocola]